MRWKDNLGEFVDWCLETRDEPAFVEALASVPNDKWLNVETTLGLKLFKAPNAMPGMNPAAMAPLCGIPDEDFDLEDIHRQKQIIFGREQIARRSSIQV